MSKNSAFHKLFFSKTKDFLDLFLLRQEQRSLQTVKAYRISLSSFYEYVTLVKGIKVMQFCFSDCTYEFILGYSQYLQEEKKLANSSVNQRIAAIKSYLKYVSDGNIELMQTYMGVQKVPLLRLSKLQRPVLEKDILKLMLEKPADTVKGRRDRMLLILLFDTAIRASELQLIRISDISLDVELHSIMIHGKGKKERGVVLNQKTAEHLKKYILHYHGERPEPRAPLFFTIIHGKVNPISERNIERIVKKYADIVRKERPDIPDSVYPHMLRRSRASGLYRDGVPLEMIAAILGHSSSETTKIYAIPSVEQLRNAIEKGQPDIGKEEILWTDNEAEMKKIFGLN